MTSEEYIRIVITGANGFVAKQVIKSLSQKNYYIYAVTSSSVKECSWMQSLDHVEMIEADASEYYQLKKRISDKCDILINFAWRETRGDERDNSVLQDENVKNSMELVQSMQEIGCNRIIQIGSLAEYGKQDEIITEASVCRPITEYAKAKLRCYEEMKSYCENHKIHFVELRLGSVYGEGMLENVLLKKIINSLKNGEACNLTTSCEQKWEYIHIKDVVDIVIQVIESSKIEGIYNITNSDTRKLKDFIGVIETKLGKHEYITYGTRSGGLGCQAIFCDNKKTTSSFDCKNMISFEDGIDKIIEETAKKRIKD